MAESGSYCPDVVIQVSSVTRALEEVAVGLLKDHLCHRLLTGGSHKGPRRMPPSTRWRAPSTRWCGCNGRADPEPSPVAAAARPRRRDPGCHPAGRLLRRGRRGGPSGPPTCAPRPARTAGADIGVVLAATPGLTRFF